MEDPDTVNVLIVDDSAVDRKVLKRALENLRFNVTAVGAAEQCLRALEGQSFDIALIDINMPGTNGFDLMHMIKSKPQFRDLPIVMMSSDPAEKRVVRFDISLCISASVHDVGNHYPSLQKYRIRGG
jgi:CheY-like chemotaxis protein